jgi:putative hydrolase of the HAD superfamily
MRCPFMVSNSLFSSRSPKAILWDLDDTIITDDAVSEIAWRAACRKYAPLVGKLDADDLYSLIRETSAEYWKYPEQHREGRLNLYAARREVVRLAFSNSGINAGEMADGLADTYTLEKDRAIIPVPGAMDTLRHFKQEGLRLALITNGSPDVQRQKVKRFELETLFDCILIEGEFGVGKPDERIFRAALKMLKVAASETWMVGDDLQRDLAGAQKLGIFSIWVDWRGNGLSPSSPVQPDYIIKSIQELLS